MAITRTERLAPRGVPRPINSGELYSDGIRFPWGDEAVFDMFDGNRVTYCPGPDWTGDLPASLYSTVAALTLAWRGALPIHACAVEFDGAAYLIAGESGGGKSVLTAGLIGLGARFVGDDLSVLHAAPTCLTIAPGRTTLRLDAALVDMIDATDRRPVPGDARGKWEVRPRNRTALWQLPVAGLLLLASARRPILPTERPVMLTRQLFRPNWLAALPDQHARIALILRHAPAMAMRCFPAIGATSERDPMRRARDALAAIQAMRAA